MNSNKIIARWIKFIKKQIGEEIKLNTNYSDNNHITLVGKVTSEKDLVMKYMEKNSIYLI